MSGPQGPGDLERHSQKNSSKNSTQNSSKNPDENSTQNSSKNSRKDPRENSPKNSSKNPDNNSTQNSSKNPDENSTQNSSRNSRKNPRENSPKNSSKNPDNNSAQNSSENPDENSSANSSRNPARNSSKNSPKDPDERSSKNSPKHSSKNPTRNSSRNPSRNPSRGSPKGVAKNPERVFDDSLSKDFGFLVNAPVSEDDGFVFKSEKSWTYDAPSFSEFFVLDLRRLSLAVNATAFNEVVDVDEKYLTSDQLASLSNEAARFQREFENLQKENEEKLSVEKACETSEFSIDEEIDELDFLLSLKKPQPSKGLPRAPIASSYSGAKTKAQGKGGQESHKWLDFIFEDSRNSGDFYDLGMLDE